MFTTCSETLLNMSQFLKTFLVLSGSPGFQTIEKIDGMKENKNAGEKEKQRRGEDGN